MKRYGNLYAKIYDMDNLYLAHYNARRGKGFYKEVRMVEKDVPYYLSEIQKMLINKTYKTSEYDIFTKNDGIKERTIYKLPYYPDRIVHWAIIQVIEPILLRYFTADTYSAIPWRGIHYGWKRVQNDLTKHKDECTYCLKFDIKKFYPSINHDILKAKYRRLFKDKDLLWLLDEIIDSVDDDQGIPIGNYISQYSGNFYLAEFDHWIKEIKGVKFYHRYMDDIVIFGDNKEKLHDLFYDISDYLKDNLKLTIKENWQIFPTFVRGVDFLGYRFFGDHILLRKRTAKRFKRKMLKIRKTLDNGNELADKDVLTIASYKGWLKYCNSYGLQKKYIMKKGDILND